MDLENSRDGTRWQKLQDIITQPDLPDGKRVEKVEILCPFRIFEKVNSLVYHLQNNLGFLSFIKHTKEDIRSYIYAPPPLKKEGHIALHMSVGRYVGIP